MHQQLQVLAACWKLFAWERQVVGRRAPRLRGAMPFGPGIRQFRQSSFPRSTEMAFQVRLVVFEYREQQIEQQCADDLTLVRVCNALGHHRSPFCSVRSEMKLPQPPSAFDHRGRRRCVPVLDLDPIGRAPGSIRPVAALGDDPLRAHCASVLEHSLAIGPIDMLGQPNALAGLAQQACQRRPSQMPCVAPQIGAIYFQQIERIQECCGGGAAR